MSGYARVPRTEPFSLPKGAYPMDTPVPAAFLAELETPSDPRSPHRCQDNLVNLVMMALGGVLCGADSWDEIAA